MDDLFDGADAGESICGGSDVTSASTVGSSNKSSSRGRRTALHYDSESTTGNAVVTETTTPGGRTEPTASGSSGQRDDALPPLSTLFADRECQSCVAPTTNVASEQTTIATSTSKKEEFAPQVNVAASQTGAQKPPRKRPPRPKKSSKRSRSKRNQTQQDQQLQQNGLLLMQKLLGSMTSLLRRDITPLMTSFPAVVAASPRSTPPVQSPLPFSMFCRQVPCGPLVRQGLPVPPGIGGPLIRGPLVRPVVWPSMLPGGTVPGRRAPQTASASTSAPLMTGPRSGRQKTSTSTPDVVGQSATNRLEMMTVAALRDECRRLRLPTGGPKPNLIRRLQQGSVDGGPCVTTSPYLLPTQSAVTPVQSSTAAAQRQLVAAGPATAATSIPKSSLPASTTTPNEARASLIQSQAIVARILSIRAAQRRRNAELAAAAAAAASSTATSTTTTTAAAPLPGTSTAAVSSLPLAVALPQRTPTSEVLSAMSRTMCASVPTTVPHLTQPVNVPHPGTLTSNITSPVYPLTGAQSANHVTANRQWERGQNLGQGQEEQWRLPKETGRVPELGHDEKVAGQNLGQEVTWRARDTQNQVTLCRQQQMLIYELRRQLEQSRRALIEAQTAELKCGAVEAPHRAADTTPPSVDVDLLTLPVTHGSPDADTNLQIAAGARRGSDIIRGVISPAGGMSFPVQNSPLTGGGGSAACHAEQPTFADSSSASQDSRIACLPPHDIQYRLHPNQHTFVHFSSVIFQFKHITKLRDNTPDKLRHTRSCCLFSRTCAAE